MDYSVNMGHSMQVPGQHTYAYVQQPPQSAPINVPPEPSIALTCNEQLSRGSPELWPDSMPGLLEKTRENGLNFGPVKPQKFRTEMDQDDVRLVNDLGRLSADQLMEYVKNLQNNAFVLGVEEKKQFARGRFLKVFEKRSDEVY